MSSCYITEWLTRAFFRHSTQLLIWNSQCLVRLYTAVCLISKENKTNCHSHPPKEGLKGKTTTLSTVMSTYIQIAHTALVFFQIKVVENFSFKWSGVDYTYAGRSDAWVNLCGVFFSIVFEADWRGEKRIRKVPWEAGPFTVSTVLVKKQRKHLK